MAQTSAVKPLASRSKVLRGRSWSKRRILHLGPQRKTSRWRCCHWERFSAASSSLQTLRSYVRSFSKRKKLQISAFYNTTTSLLMVNYILLYLSLAKLLLLTRKEGRLLHLTLKPGPPVSRLMHHGGAAPRPPPRQTDPNVAREEADRQRRLTNISYQDGSYGVRPPPLYSDALVQRGRGFNSSR